jgi:undecaprenyl-diphosphatase
VKKLFVGVFRFRYNAETAYFLKILLSMIPIGIVGFLFKDSLNAILSSPYILVVVGAMLLVTALLLTFATYAKPRQKENISYRDGFIIGVAQAVAAMPGLSRSGSTIATGILLGNQKAAVAQFSFLMVLLPILGEAFLNVVSGEFGAGLGIGVWPLVAGFVASFVAGCVACKFMIEMVKRSKLVWFAAYCAVVGVLSIIFYFV